jgi:GMP synthase-like glutamine amidotransferase
MANNVIIINGDAAYHRMFINAGWKVVYELAHADLACFTGGADVTPAYYGAEKHHTTWNNINRDVEEKELFDFFKERDVPMVGICRGGQFLNVMSGGAMYQDVTNHTQDHDIIDMETGETIRVTSTHHQMMKPAASAITIATANILSEREWFEGSIACRDESNTGIEVVFYPDTKSLCFQPHPEFRSEEGTRHRSYFFEQIEKRLFPV